MFIGHYTEWRESRIRGIEKYVDTQFFHKKTLLELGAGYGDLGNLFSQKGAIVTCSDGRGIHLSTIQNRYPHLSLKIIDCDKDIFNEKYDIILHWGVLYHLNSIETNLENVCNNCDYLFLETEISDTNDPSFCLKVQEEAFHLDQAANGIGSRPSPRYVESLLEKNNFNYKIILDNILNTQCHVYDSPIQETKEWKNGLRRYWICWKKGVPCPIKSEYMN